MVLELDAGLPPSLPPSTAPSLGLELLYFRLSTTAELASSGNGLVQWSVPKPCRPQRPRGLRSHRSGLSHPAERDLTWDNFAEADFKELQLSLEQARAPSLPYTHTAHWHPEKAREDYDPETRQLRLRRPTPIQDRFAAAVGGKLLEKPRTRLRALEADGSLWAQRAMSRGHADINFGALLKKSPDYQIGFCGVDEVVLDSDSESDQPGRSIDEEQHDIDPPDH